MKKANKTVDGFILSVFIVIFMCINAYAECRNCNLFKDPNNPTRRQCTKYVCEKRTNHFYGCVTWSGNGGEWLSNAKNAGYRTGNIPKPGAILVTNEGSVGHVAFVEWVDSEKKIFYVSESNLRLRGEFNERNIKFNDRIISGFIYGPNTIRTVGGVGWYPAGKTCVNAEEWFRIKNGKPIATLKDEAACISAGYEYVYGTRSYLWEDVLFGDNLPQYCTESYE